MKLLVLGASGGIGRYLVSGAVRRGHEVTAAIRSTSPARFDSVARVLRGEALDPGFLAEAVEGHPVVLSALGLRRAGILPWAPLRSPPDLVRSVMTHLVSVSPRQTRVVWVSAGGVLDSRARLSPFVRKLVTAGNVGVAYTDLEEAERRVLDAGRTWLAVRPVTLTPGEPTGRAGPVQRYGLWSHVRRSDVAEWMLDVADGTRAHEEPSVLLGRAGHDASTA